MSRESEREELARLITRQPKAYSAEWDDCLVLADALISAGYANRREGGPQDCMAYILTRRLERGDVVDAEAIEDARVLCGTAPKATEADHEWARQTAAELHAQGRLPALDRHRNADPST